MTMRDKIAAIIETHTLSVDSRNAADAIIAALPDMVDPLVWDGPRSVRGGYFIDTGVKHGKFYVLHRSGSEGGGPIDGPNGDIWFDTDEAAKAAANTHHRAQVLSAFNGTKTPTDPT